MLLAQARRRLRAQLDIKRSVQGTGIDSVWYILGIEVVEGGK